MPPPLIQQRVKGKDVSPEWQLQGQQSKLFKADSVRGGACQGTRTEDPFVAYICQMNWFDKRNNFRPNYKLKPSLRAGNPLQKKKKEGKQ